MNSISSTSPIFQFLGVKNARVRLDVLLKDLVKKTEERYV